MNSKNNLDYKKVVLGLSGGVDSTAAALLLKSKGLEVIGLYFNVHKQDKRIEEKSRKKAQDIADELGIKLHTVDVSDDFEECVINNFLLEYTKGRTPNPCIICNPNIKFKTLIDVANSENAHYIATGHYAKMEDGFLKKAKDSNKDQSYFLCKLSKEQLENAIFPLADIEKPEVRKIALENDLITAKKKDSTGICFIGERNFKNFLNNYFPNKKGNVIDIATNKVVGTHNGLMYYTIGQRRGLDIGGSEDRMFVVGKNLEKNILYITYSEDSKYLYSNSCLVEDVSFTSDLRPKEVGCKFRYRQDDKKAEITYLDDNKILVRYDSAKAVCPGQVCAIYKDDICIGGGIISKLYQDDKEMTYVI